MDEDREFDVATEKIKVVCYHDNGYERFSTETADPEFQIKALDIIENRHIQIVNGHQKIIDIMAPYIRIDREER